MDYQGPERRAHERIETHAKAMIKIGLGNEGCGFGDIRRISRSSMVLWTDILGKATEPEIARIMQVEPPIIVIGIEAWSRHFSLMGRIVRINAFPYTEMHHIACMIKSTTSDAFLQAWIERDKKAVIPAKAGTQD